MNLGGAIRLNKSGLLIIVVILVVLAYTVLVSSKKEENYKVVDLRQLLTVSIKAAQNGGAEVVAVKDHLVIENKGKTLEGVNDSVTTADYRSHCVMVQTLQESFPGVTLISEEAKADCKKHTFVKTEEVKEEKQTEKHSVNVNDFVKESDVTIWIDPLDATKEYTERLYEYVTTIVCVAVKGKPVIGVIYKPFTKELSWAWVGKSHKLNVEQKSKPENGKIRIVISRSHAGDKVFNELQTMFDNIDIQLQAGAGYKALEVAAGNADVYIHATNIKKWDICAGNAILDALGGRMSTRDNQLIDYSDTKHVVNTGGIIASLKNHDKFVRRS